MIGSTRSEQQWLDRIEANRDYLRRLERELEQRLGTAGGSGGPPAAMEDGDRAELMNNRALLSVLAENRAQIGRALERLEAGVYGTCEDCGARIDEERLRFRPESTRCVACQSAYEEGRRIA